jgi:hypothetical protein
VDQVDRGPKKKGTPQKTMTTAYVILFHGSAVGVMTSISDAANVAKSLGRGSSIVSCLLNDFTPTGKQLAANNPSLNGFSA